MHAHVRQRGPLAHVDGQARARGAQVRRPRARFADVLRLRERVVGVGVELVVVGVDGEVARGGGGGAEGAGDGDEGRRALEGIVRHDDEVRVRGHGFDGAVRVRRPLLAHAEAVVPRERGLVDDFQADDHVRVHGAAVFLRHGHEHGRGAVEVVALLPEHAALAAGVVLAVLAAGAAVQVDPDFHVELARPLDGELEVVVCALDEGRVRCVVGPVADGDAERVDAVGGERFGVRGREPRGPVLLKGGGGVGGGVEGPLVDGGGGGTGEEVGLHPFLEDEPVADVYAAEEWDGGVAR